LTLKEYFPHRRDATHKKDGSMKASTVPVIALLALFAMPVDCRAGQSAFADAPDASFMTRSSLNNTPLVFGMGVEDVSRVLGEPLQYVSGRRGNEIYLTFRNTSGNGLFFRRDRLYLQFRKGRLTGWKGDGGHDWTWRW
jgi:hypothetical protein